MATRPNIFDYAQKELTQDAMICWLLECCRSSDKEYQKIGFDFIRFIFEDEALLDGDIELENKSPHNQYYHMDVYANIRIRDKIYPLIFEDKTNTYLHDGQHNKYLQLVKQWKEKNQWGDWRNELFSTKNLNWEETIFIFFKIGYIFDWQKNELEKIGESLKDDNAKLKIITLADIADFIKEHETKDELLGDYSLFLQNRLSETDSLTEAKYNGYFNKIFNKGAWFDYSYQGWAAKNFAYIEDISKQGDNRIMYSVRTGKWKNGSKREYAIAFQQYRNEKTISGSEAEKKRLTEERYEITKYSKELCEEIFAKLDKKINVQWANADKQKLPSQNNLFKIFVNAKNEDEVCELFHDFIRVFVKKLQRKYNVIDVIDK